MDFDGTREANRFTCQALDSGAEGQVVTLDTLREDFAGQVFLLWHFSGVTAPVVAGHHTDTERSQQCQQFPAGLIVTGAEGPGQYIASFGTVSVPEPVLLRLAANEAPLLIEFTDKGNIRMSDRCRSYPPGRELFNVRMTVLMPIFSTLAVSRTPAPKCAISTICSLTPGFRAS